MSQRLYRWLGAAEHAPSWAHGELLKVSDEDYNALPASIKRGLMGEAAYQHMLESGRGGQPLKMPPADRRMA